MEKSKDRNIAKGEMKGLQDNQVLQERLLETESVLTEFESSVFKPGELQSDLLRHKDKECRKATCSPS